MQLPEDAPWIVRKLVFAVIYLPFQLPIILMIPGKGAMGYVVAGIGMVAVSLVVAFALSRLATKSRFIAWIAN